MSHLSQKRKLPDTERFPDLVPEVIEQNRKVVKKVNTEKSDKKCEKVFVQWLT